MGEVVAAVVFELVLVVKKLKNAWLPDKSIFGLGGLVLAEPILDRWGIAARFESFAPGYRWLPYRGTPTL